jgi:hypothetical protein
VTIDIVLGVGFAAAALVGAAVLREVRALRGAAAELAAAERRDRAFALGRLESALGELRAQLLEARGRRVDDRPTLRMDPASRAAPADLPDDEPEEEEATKVAPRPAGNGLRLRGQPSAPGMDRSLPDPGCVERRTLLPPPSAKAR